MIDIRDDIDFLVITGPTAIGKSDLGVELALEHDGEIINADSVQVYKGLDIGSAKIQTDEMRGIPHHLLDIKEPDEEYSVGSFQRDARAKIEEVKKRGKLPIVVGGTGLYLNSIIYDYKLENEIDRLGQIYQDLEILSSEELFSIIEPVALKEGIEVHVNNRTRNLIYAYKVRKGLPLRQGELKMSNCQIISLTDDRKNLYNKIDQRVDLMLSRGLVEEVAHFKSDWPSQRAIGYKEVHEYLEGHITEKELENKIKINTRHFAKRQITWIKNKLEKVEWYEKKGKTWQKTQI